MIVAIVDKRIVAHADTVTECQTKVLSDRPAGYTFVRFRVAPAWLQSLAERGEPLDTFTVVVSGDDVIAEDEDIRRIREHVIAKALENTK